jgi:hypothetical protein
LNQDLQQFIWVCFHGLTNLDKFHDVHPPFAAFVFGDEGLLAPKKVKLVAPAENDGSREEA